MKKVVILYKSFPQYRLEFFNLLREDLKKHQIDLVLVYGDYEYGGRGDNVSADWAISRKNVNIPFFRGTLLWQPALKEIRDADLVIVEQASRLLINFYLIGRRFLRRRRFAFWGHGMDLKASHKNILNVFKKLYSTRTDWWFAYTDGVKKRIESFGFPPEKITVAHNAIDTKSLQHIFHQITPEEKAATRAKYSIAGDEKVLIYCGALYKEKRLDLMVDACDALASKGYHFKLLVVGGGKDEQFVREAAKTRSWLVMTGPLFQKQKALAFSVSDIFLLPGAIGLAVLDSFTFECPIITTRNKLHGPEFEYIENGVNGLITGDGLDEYVNAVVSLIDNPAKLQQLKQHCADSAQQYTVENMVHRFSDGVREALEQLG